MSARFWKLKEAGSGTVFIATRGEDDKRKSNSINLARGAIIGGAYRIIELIGRGGMGEVYLARHETLGKKCALKVIPPEQVTEAGWQRFQLEAKAVAKLEHLNLVRVTDLGIHQGCLPFYAMDFVEGKTLAELLVESGPMPLTVILDLFIQVCDGVDCAHRSGILHRDLKPANIMVQQTKTGQRIAKILDFGLAKLTSHDRTKQSLTAVGDIFGSPFYMSPEQCNGDKLDRRSDIYSIGCTMFECLTGQPPFTGHLASAVIFSHMEADPPSLESIVGQGRLPASLEIVMAKLLRKNPVERYQSLLELRGDMERVVRKEEVQPFYVSRGGNSQDLAEGEPSKTALPEMKTTRQNNQFRRHSLSGVVKICSLVLGLVLAVLGTMSLIHSTNKDDKRKIVEPAAERSPGKNYSAGEGRNDRQARARKSETPELSKQKGTGHEDSGSEYPKSLYDGLQAITEGGPDGESGPEIAGNQTPDSGFYPWRKLMKMGASSEEVRSVALSDVLSLEQSKNEAVAKLTTLVDHNRWTAFWRSGIFHFPKDVIIGSVSVEGQTPQLAVGDIAAASGKDAFLYLLTSTAYFPQLLDKFGPNDLTGIAIVFRLPRDVEYAIRKMESWKRLKDIWFFNPLGKPIADNSDDWCESEISDELLPMLDNFNGLRSVGLCCPATGPAILKRPFLKTISGLALRRVGQFTPLLNELPHLDNLNELFLTTMATQNEDLKIIAEMKNLRKLTILRSFLTPESLRYFKRMRALRELHLDRNDWTAKQKADFQKNLPRCKICFEKVIDLKPVQFLPKM
jgi:serine/threonine protein kinase